MVAVADLPVGAEVVEVVEEAEVEDLVDLERTIPLVPTRKDRLLPD